MKSFTVISRGDAFSKKSCSEIKERLISMGKIHDEESPDLVVCVGGDGTLLHAFHQYLDKVDEVAFVGIHTGTLGFSTDYIMEEIEEFYSDLASNKVTIEEKSILEATCYKEDEIMKFNALNEIRIENIVKTQHVEVYLNDEYFELFRGNGLCVSGQYGSTAYNRSIGGAVIFHGLELLQLTEISGIHHRHARSLAAPLILDPKTTVRMEYENFDHALLCYDHLHIHLENIHKIEVKLNTKKMRFAHFREFSYIDKLNALF
ncbi:MAG: NAD kinase [Erysipelothrix sp.]|nr:NAD kinase [Erysipelothrix sp.]